MLKHYAAGPQLKFPRAILAACCFALILLLFPARASAYTTGSPTRGISLQVTAGFNENYRINYWIPVQITLNNSGPIFNGTLDVLTFTAQGRSNTGPATYSPWNFE